MKNLFGYALEQGGVGIVKADSLSEAKQKVVDAYSRHSGDEFTEEVTVFELAEPFNDAPDVIEVCDY